MNIYWFDRILLPEDDFAKKIKREKLNLLIEQQYKEEQQIDVHWIDYSEKVIGENSIINFLEMFLRSQLTGKNVIVFNNLYTISDDIKRSIRTANEYHYLKKVRDVYFADISLKKLFYDREKIFNILGMKDNFHSGPRRKLTKLMPNTFAVVAKLFNGASSERRLGHDFDKIKFLDSKCQYVKQDDVADFIGLTPRVIRHVVKQDKNTQQGILDLSTKQKQLLQAAMVKDFKVARSKLKVNEMIEHIR